MANRMFQIVAVIGAFALIGMLSFSVIAEGDEVAKKGGSFLRHLHSGGHQMHGGGDHHDHMAQLIDDLNLTPTQHRHLEKVHEIMSVGHGMGPMETLHEQLMTQVQQGDVDAGEIKQLIDGHVEEIRLMAYGITDELVALVNELDSTQRETLLQHVQAAKAAGHGHGH